MTAKQKDPAGGLSGVVSMVPWPVPSERRVLEEPIGKQVYRSALKKRTAATESQLRRILAFFNHYSVTPW